MIQLSLQEELQAALVLALGLPGPIKLQLRQCGAPYDYSFVAHFCRTDAQWGRLEMVLRNWLPLAFYDRTDNGYVNFALKAEYKLGLLEGFLGALPKPRTSYGYERLLGLRPLLVSRGHRPVAPTLEGAPWIMDLCSDLLGLRGRGGEGTPGTPGTPGPGLGAGSSSSSDVAGAVDTCIEAALGRVSLGGLPSAELDGLLWLAERVV